MAATAWVDAWGCPLIIEAANGMPQSGQSALRPHSGRLTAKSGCQKRTSPVRRIVSNILSRGAIPGLLSSLASQGPMVRQPLNHDLPFSKGP